MTGCMALKRSKHKLHRRYVYCVNTSVDKVFVQTPLSFFLEKLAGWVFGGKSRYDFTPFILTRGGCLKPSTASRCVSVVEGLRWGVHIHFHFEKRIWRDTDFYHHWGWWYLLSACGWFFNKSCWLSLSCWLCWESETHKSCEPDDPMWELPSSALPSCELSGPLRRGVKSGWIFLGESPRLRGGVKTLHLCLDSRLKVV